MDELVCSVLTFVQRLQLLFPLQLSTLLTPFASRSYPNRLVTLRSVGLREKGHFHVAFNKRTYSVSSDLHGTQRN